jgi:linoleoyl-CoA desaturase
MLGSANISGGKALHIMTGNLSYQIEHHLFPDLPSNRYQEIAPQVQALFEEYGLTYTTGPLPKQVASAWSKVIRLSLPNGYAEEAKRTLRRRLGRPVTKLVGLAGGASAQRTDVQDRELVAS